MQTSTAALNSVHVKHGQALVLRAFLNWGPSTDEEIYAVITGISPSGARSRRAELVRGGLIEPTGNTKKLSSGRLGTIWQATATARQQSKAGEN